MRRLITKADRLSVQTGTIDYLIQKGWQKQTHHGRIFLTYINPETGQGHLKGWKGTQSTTYIDNLYRNAESLQNALNKAIENAESAAKWKREQKEKNKGNLTGAAACAAAIRADLKKAFPGVKFSVRSENFAGGDAVRVGWEDGPTRKQVEAITQNYTAGSFNAMEDIYEYTHRGPGPKAKFITTRREMSETTQTVLKPLAEQIMTHNEPGPDCWDAQALLYRIFSATSLPAGAIVTGLKPTIENYTGISERFYLITYTAPEAPAQTTEPTQHTPAGQGTHQPGEMQIIDYSAKAIAVIGDTKPYKEELKAAGGSFNPRLTCGAGWVFSKSRLEQVKALLESL